MLRVHYIIATDMFSPFRQKKYEIPLVSVDLGAGTVRVPVAELSSGKDGKTLLITAGNDGDEYAGIEACYRIIEEFSHTPFSGKLIVIPIVNIPGFEAEMSQNPLDGKFPKYIYPGNINGSASERLRYWVSEYAESSDFWLDLHGGSLVESLVPFAWGWKSDQKDIDATVLSMIQKFPLPYSALSKSLRFSKRLASRGCGYVLTESGAGGDNTGKSVELQTTMVRIVMNELHMIEGDYQQCSKKIYGLVSDHILKKSGIWHSIVSHGMVVQKGSIIGTVCSLSGDTIETVIAKHNGMILWVKVGLSGRKGDVVAGLGC